ncbi:HAD family hydrolase [Plantactinospora sp. B5E13]|uniref:HAD family hydrolase n=1 Tax=unclassified Plantactinospora TaxID=2631981 RepID=UPI00325F06F1
MFDTVVCGNGVTNPKPHPEAYLTATDRLGVDPRACVALEDPSRGIAAALAAGCLVVAVPEASRALADADGHAAVVVPLETVTVDRLTSLPAGPVG